MKFHWVLIHSTCVVAFIIQFGIVLNGFIYPSMTNTVVHENNLQELDFPLVFKICVQPAFNLTALEEAGYDTKYGSFRYFVGRSKYNRSVYGWAGHTNTSGVVASVEEILSRVSLHTQESVLSKVKVFSMTNEVILINIREHFHNERANYPQNCFTLDLTNNTEIKKKGIKHLFIYFKSQINSSVKLNAIGANLACNRNIKTHKFFSSDPMKIDKLNEFTKRYVVVINKHVLMEEDPTNQCMNYPYSSFESFK